MIVDERRKIRQLALHVPTERNPTFQTTFYPQNVPTEQSSSVK